MSTNAVLPGPLHSWEPSWSVEVLCVAAGGAAGDAAGDAEQPAARRGAAIGAAGDAAGDAEQPAARRGSAIGAAAWRGERRGARCAVRQAAPL